MSTDARLSTDASRRREPVVIDIAVPEPPQEQMIMHLERDQIVAETSRPLARAELSSRAITGLWALRVFVVIVSVMVIYTFFAQLQ